MEFVKLIITIILTVSLSALTVFYALTYYRMRALRSKTKPELLRVYRATMVFFMCYTVATGMLLSALPRIEVLARIIEITGILNLGNALVILLNRTKRDIANENRLSRKQNNQASN